MMSEEKNNKSSDDCLWVPRGKWPPLEWYGSWEQLNSAFDWCVKYHFLDLFFIKYREEWLRANFHEHDERPSLNNFFDGKLNWHGKLETIIEFFLKLKEENFIDENKISEWIVDHFLHDFRGGT